MKKKSIFIVNGGISASVVGGAPISVLKINEKLNTKFNSYLISSLDSPKIQEKQLRFAKLGHVSFDPLRELSLKNVLDNWRSAIIYLNYLFKTSRGVLGKVSKNDIVLNNGHWILNADIWVVRFCLKSYLRNLKNNKSLPSLLVRVIDFKINVILVVEKMIVKSKKLKKVVVLSEEGKEDLLKSYPFLEDKIIVIPNGVDYNTFEFSKKKRLEVRKNLKISSNSIVIVFAGGNNFRKNLLGVYEIYFQLVKKVKKEVHLILLTKKDRVNSQLFKEIKRNKKIHFIEWTKNPEYYYSAGDIFLFPSIYDTGAKVVLESAVNGMYCLISSTSGVSEFLFKEHSNVVNNKVFVAKNYTKYLIKIIEDRKYITKRNSKRMKNSILNWSKVAEKYLNLLEKI